MTSLHDTLGFRLPELPHLTRAERILFNVLVLVFSYIHPKYGAYLDAYEQRERMEYIIARAKRVQTYWHRTSTIPQTRHHLCVRATNLPDICRALMRETLCTHGPAICTHRAEPPLYAHLKPG